MPAFLLRRLLEALVVLLAAAAIAFVLFQFIGDPVAQMLPMDAPLRTAPGLPLRSASTSRAGCSF